MMKKTAAYLFAGLFAALCLIFSLGLLIPGAADSDGDEMPSLMTDGRVNDDFSNQFEEWFSKNFAFHDTVTDLYADLKLALFDEGNDQVVVGKDDFLFFDDTTADYIGSDPMTDEEIDRIADGLASLNRTAAENGGKFLFVCAPNKNTVYPEYMPERYLKNTGETDLDRLYAALDRNGVPYADLRPVLEAHKTDGLLYHRRDTHWNGLGAYTAFREISGIMGFEVCDLTERGPVTVGDFEGDLDALLFPGKVMYDENITYDFTGLYVYTSAYSTPMDLVITTRGGGEGKLLMFRDSFANALIPYAASSFAEVRMERGTPYQTGQISETRPDYVIVEISERNLRELSGHLGLD